VCLILPGDGEKMMDHIEYQRQREKQKLFSTLWKTRVSETKPRSSMERVNMWMCTFERESPYSSVDRYFEWQSQKQTPRMRRLHTKFL